MAAAILVTETRIQELETTLNDLHATHSREAHGLIVELEAAKAEVTRLYERARKKLGVATPESFVKFTNPLVFAMLVMIDSQSTGSVRLVAQSSASVQLGRPA